MAEQKRAAIYTRVSTKGQDTARQIADLEHAASIRGWRIVARYEDLGISGAKGRDKRPQLDRMLKDATRGKFDVVMSWHVDRIGRSLPDLLSSLQELHGARVDLFLHQTAIDTTTPSGRALFGMLGVFAEFERSMTVERVRSGMAQAQEEQRAGKVRRRKDGTVKKAIGRPALPPETRERIKSMLREGLSQRGISRAIRVSPSVVNGLAKEMAASD